MKKKKPAILIKTIYDLACSKCGIFITTSYFSPDAEKEANRDGGPPIELVDGEKLADMFEKTELGLKPVTTYEIDKVFFIKYMNDYNWNA